MSFFKGVAIYGISNALTAAVQFGIFFIFANRLGPDGFGYFSVFSVLYSVFSMLTGLGLTAAVQRTYFEVDFEAFKLLLSTVLKAVALFSILIALVLLTMPGSVENYIRLPKFWVLYALFSSLGQVYIQIIQIVLQSQARSSLYLAVAGLQGALFIGSSLIFIATDQVRWESAVIAHSVAPILVGFFSLLFFWREGCRPNAWSMKFLRNSLVYSLPLVPHQVAGWVISMVDRLIIANYFGVAQVGIYSLSFQIAQSTNVVSGVLNQAMVPLLFRKLAEPKPKWSEIQRINLFYAVGLLAFSVVLLVAFLGISPYVLKKEYAPVSNYAPWLILAFFMLSASRIASNYLMYYRKTVQLSILTLVSSLISVTLNFMLIPSYGVIAACWSSVGAFSFLLFATSWYAYKCRYSLLK